MAQRNEALASSVNSLLALLFVGFVISVQISPSAKVWVKFMEKIKKIPQHLLWNTSAT